MSLFVREAPKERHWWISTHADCRLTDDFKALEAVDEETGETVGMVGFYDWRPNCVSVHIAGSRRGMKSVLIPEALKFAFARVGIILGFVPAFNPAARRLALEFGFAEIHRIADGWEKGADMILFELRGKA